MRFILSTPLALCFLIASATLAQSAEELQICTYVTSSQVESLFGTSEASGHTLDALKTAGVTKVFLESVRSGQSPNWVVLAQARDYLREHGIEASAGIATTSGHEFGVPSNQPGIWLNYQNEQTRLNLAALVEKTATMFDELIVDDFLATDDESEESIKARGERGWSEYRLDLMTRIARDCIIKPAREANPNIRVILKYPQWYDRFHRFGYNVVTGPELFDAIWVGTETRNPDTKRFGFVAPTEGFVNFAWLRSIAKDKTGGGWFDFGDCLPGVYLMQAYQSVLAGAPALVLFEAGSVVENNECITPFIQRQAAVKRLHEIIDGAALTGMQAYKPPHSEGSDEHGAANLYIYDFAAAMGLSLVPTASAPSGDSPVFLARQAADDPAIADRIHAWLKEKRTLVVTPDFLSAIEDDSIIEAAGYKAPYPLGRMMVEADAFIAGGANIPATTENNAIRVTPEAATAKAIVSARAGGQTPALFSVNHPESGGAVYTLNLPTFQHEEFAPTREQFLPPRPLPVTHWPEEVVNAIRGEISQPYAIKLEAPNGVSATYFDNGVIVLANFHDSLTACRMRAPFDPHRIGLHPRFPHAEGTGLQIVQPPDGDAYAQVSIQPWEIAVLEIKAE
ncbi:MAG: hypothetical protein GC154_21685 [bacterium]|nr:hypothetical protein [bacterium]